MRKRERKEVAREHSSMIKLVRSLQKRTRPRTVQASGAIIDPVKGGSAVGDKNVMVGLFVPLDIKSWKFFQAPNQTKVNKIRPGTPACFSK